MKDKRPGPIRPEDHPMTPWPIRRVLKEKQHQELLEKLYKEHVKEDNNVIKRLLWYAFLAWTAYVTLAYFGILGEARELWNGLLGYLAW